MNIAIIPIRDDSTRLANKATGFVLCDGLNPVECITARLSRSKLIDKIIYIIPDTYINSKLIDNINKLSKTYEHVSSYIGSVNDISGRACASINYATDERIINVTGDCVFSDPMMIDFLILMHKLKQEKTLCKKIYVSNVITRSYPDGFDVQVFNSSLLFESRNISLDKKTSTQMGWDIVNYSGYLTNDLHIYNFPAQEEHYMPEICISIDYENDITVAKKIFSSVGLFSPYNKIIEYIKKDYSWIKKMNDSCRRNIPGACK